MPRRRKIRLHDAWLAKLDDDDQNRTYTFHVVGSVRYWDRVNPALGWRSDDIRRTLWLCVKDFPIEESCGPSGVSTFWFNDYGVCCSDYLPWRFTRKSRVKDPYNFFIKFAERFPDVNNFLPYGFE